MSKLPEAFLTKMWNAKDDNLTHREKEGWANGYNSCLEATGARELYEALEMVNTEGIKHRYDCMISEQMGMDLAA